MESTELSVLPQQSLFVSPIVGMTEAKAKFEQVREFTASCLTKGVDFGNVPGVSKPSLLKPGAEKLGSLFGLTPRFKLIDKVMNWNGEGNPDSEPFFYFEYKCELYRAGEFVASCDASCNSWEKKYRYRKAELRCPNCGKPTIIKGKKEYGGGWICYAKKGGCGAKFPDNDPRFAVAADVKNFDTAEQVNTFQKMAQKRAYVGAILIACNLSEYYTQDVEDMAHGTFIPDSEMVEGDFTPVAQSQRAQAAGNGQKAYNSAPAQEKPTETPQKRQFDEVEFLKNWNRPQGVSGMSRMNAEKMTDRQGQPYGEKSTEQLFYMLNAITKKIDTLTEDQKPDYQLKVSAICEILQNRKLDLVLPEERPDPFVKQNPADPDDIDIPWEVHP
jgi:hypothetical protein